MNFDVCEWKTNIYMSYDREMILVDVTRRSSGQYNRDIGL